MSKILLAKNYYSNESLKSFFALCKPRVTALIVFTAIIGMFLATPGMVPIDILIAASIGIAFVSGAAAAFNCLIEEKIDAVMARTRGRPLPTGQVSQKETIIFSSILGGSGLLILFYFVNFLTMWLTLATFFAYAVIYTIFLKPATPMNIVIGGASGAMPPVLGWAAVNNSVAPTRCPPTSTLCTLRRSGKGSLSIHPRRYHSSHSAVVSLNCHHFPVLCTLLCTR